MTHEKMIIIAKLDVIKIRKELLFPGKNGAKYLDIALIESVDDAYGNDFMIVQSLPQSERDAGKRGPILGNGKFIKGNPKSQRHNHHEEREAQPEEPSDDDQPF